MCGPGFKGDPWQLLQVKKGASKLAVKRAFQRAAMKAHPDAGGTPNAFMNVQRAYAAIQQVEASVSKTEANDSFSTRREEIARRAAAKRRPRKSRSWDYVDKWQYTGKGTLEPDSAAFKRQAFQKVEEAMLHDPGIQPDYGWAIFAGCVVIVYAYWTFDKYQHAARVEKLKISLDDASAA
ncbi:hypothetical protein DIPPA_01557 [Diplonema papillatum]|nr:hypothetical protein DIPPA_01557 [Diplonema papillatum]|eukprot:gene17068-26184_t